MASKKDKKLAVKGIRIKSLNILMIAAALVLCGFFVQNSLDIKKGYSALAQTSEECLRYRKDAQMAKEGSYYLTEQVHLYVATGEKPYADNYFREVNETKRRDDAIDDLRSSATMSSAHETLIDAMRKSNELMEREIYAIRLVADANGDDISTYDERVQKCEISMEDDALSADAKRELADQVVFGASYLNYRDRIDEDIRSFVDATYKLAEEEKQEGTERMHRKLVWQFVLIVLVFVLAILDSSCTGYLILKPLKIYMKCVREGRTFELLGAYEFKHLALTYNNIFEVQHENEKMLRQRAERDPLTGLLNRGAYNRISAQYSERDLSVAVLIIDIDNFKTVNDTYGHAIGDEVIQSVGELLLSSFRPSDIVARIGGDEFTVIMLDVTEESTESIEIKIDTLNEALQKPASALPAVSLSVGVAFSEYGYCDEVLHLADEALYETKRTGKCGCSFNEKVILKPKEEEEKKEKKGRRNR